MLVVMLAMVAVESSAGNAPTGRPGGKAGPAVVHEFQNCQYCRTPEPKPNLKVPPSNACHCAFENGSSYPNGSTASYEAVARACGPVWLSGDHGTPIETAENGVDYNMFPSDALLYNLTGELMYADRATKSLKWLADAFLRKTLVDDVNHCFEVLVTYTTLLENGIDAYAGNATLYQAFRAAMLHNCYDHPPDDRGTEAVHNHGIDYALDLTFLLKVFPDIVDGSTAAIWRAAANQTWQDWIHGHALMENSLNYNGISLTRLIELAKVTPGGVEDMRSTQWHDLVSHYVKEIATNGIMPSWGGSLQNDGCASTEAAVPFVYFFERAATDFNSPEFAWAARQTFAAAIPDSPPKPSEWLIRSALEVRQRETSGKAITVPDFIDQSATVAWRNTYATPVPDKLVVAASRKSGSAYAMLEAFAVPIGFHGSEEQTGGVLHYEFNETLFMFNPFSKHYKEASMAEGMPIVYPDTPTGRKVFPWRYGGENILADGDSWQLEDAATDRIWNGWSQNWNNFLTRSFVPESGKFGTDAPLGITCGFPGNFTVDIANVSLIGPGVMPVPLEDFRKYRIPWKATMLVEDPVDGGMVARLDCGKSDCGSNGCKGARDFKNSSLLPSLPGTFDRQVYTHVRYYWRVSGFTSGNSSCPCPVCDNLDNRSSTTCNVDLDPHPLDKGLPFSFNGGGGFMGALSVTNAWWPRLDNHSVYAETMPTQRDSSSIAGSAAASYGRLNMTGSLGASADLVWKRQLILSAKTGVLLVVDTITPSSAQDGYLSGVLWKFMTNEETPLGELTGDWISLGNHERSSFRRNKRQASHVAQQCSTDHRDQCPVDAPNPQRLLVKFGGNDQSGTERYGVATGWKAPSQRNADLSPIPEPPFLSYGPRNVSTTATLWNTVYSKRKLAGGKQNIFVSLFTPHWDSDAASTMADGTTITVDDTKGRVNVHAALEGGNGLDVTVGPDDHWSCKYIRSA